MPDHGFGKTLTGSPISDEDLEETVRQISALDYIARAWVVKHVLGGSAANINFQFKHISKYDKTHAQMVAEIEAIVVNGHSPHNTDIYVKQKAFVEGLRRAEQDKQ